ncbi:MAG: IPT/TIG domain-containing protein [Methanoregula sp.]|nr:IPT/TIG domain-containing protein [Methanoregula sp.]
MEKGIRNGLLICAILVLVVLIAGCSDQSSTGTTPVPTTALPAAKFAAGDIIAKSASSTEQTLYVITQYDTKNDKYTRAWIHKNSDGSWGHFNDNKTEKVERTLVEKVYPVKLTHVAVSSIAIVTPTIPPTVVTTLSGRAPTVTGISPASGASDAVVGVTITGTNFESGATAKLMRAGYPSISATGVSVSSATSIGCTFNLKSADEGSYNVMVTNPGGQSDTRTGAFSIGQAPPIITGVSPNTAELNATQLAITINGQNFKDGVKVTFVQGTTELYCVTPTSMATNKITCTLDIKTSNGGKIGLWDVKVLNIDGQQTGTLAGKFSVTNETRSSS